MIATAFILTLGIYLLAGLVFAVPFVILGVGRTDSRAAGGSRGFRVLIIPGAIMLWPLLLLRWAKGAKEPPSENTAHRRAATEKRAS